MDTLKIGYKVLLPAEQRYAKFVWGKLTTIQDDKSKEN
jgi:SecD/SecF fusion protein